jgi:hypothetical protein
MTFSDNSLTSLNDVINVKNDLTERFPYFLTNANINDFMSLIHDPNFDLSLTSTYSKKNLVNFTDYFDNELCVTYNIIRKYKSNTPPLTEKEWLLFCLHFTL